MENGTKKYIEMVECLGELYNFCNEKILRERKISEEEKSSEEKMSIKKRKCHEQLSLFAWGLQGRERESADTEPNTFYAYYTQP